MSIGDAEIKTQERVIRFFKDPEILGYQYIGNLSDYQNKNIKEDRLRQYLRLKGYADKLIDAAIMQLQQEFGSVIKAFCHILAARNIEQFLVFLLEHKTAARAGSDYIIASVNPAFEKLNIFSGIDTRIVYITA